MRQERLGPSLKGPARGILAVDPFVSIGREGVGELVRIGRAWAQGPAQASRCCGEHGGNSAAVAFCHQIGRDDVSCSPFRVPMARLATAQAALGKDGPARRNAHLRDLPAQAAGFWRSRGAYDAYDNLQIC